MKKVVTAVMLAMLAAPAVASDFYAGAKFGSANYGYSNVTNNNQSGFGIFGGYQFSRRFSAEVEYANLGGFDATGGTFKGSSIGVNGVGTFALGEKFALIGKVGIANTKIDATANAGYVLTGTSSFSATGLTLGFAGQYNVAPAFGLRAGIDVYPIGDSTSGTTTARLLSVGGVFKF